MSSTQKPNEGGNAMTSIQKPNEGVNPMDRIQKLETIDLIFKVTSTPERWKWGVYDCPNCRGSHSHDAGPLWHNPRKSLESEIFECIHVDTCEDDWIKIGTYTLLDDSDRNTEETMKEHAQECVRALLEHLKTADKPEEPTQ